MVMPFVGIYYICHKFRISTFNFLKKFSLPVKIKIFSKKNTHNEESQERVSSSTSPGSLTLEAACVLPIFVMLLIALLQIMEILSIQAKLQQSVHEVSKELSHYAYIYNKREESEQDFSFIEGIAGNIITESYVKSKVIQSIGKAYLEESIIKKGGGLYFYDSVFLEEDGIIDIVLRYKITLRYNIFHIPDMSVVLRARSRAWIGTEESVIKEGEAGVFQSAYIAENGVVYHVDSECSHLRLSISQISMEEVPNMRNESGHKYYSCEFCGENGTVMGALFITNTGTRYHTNIECSGLKRSVSTIDISELENIPVCSRCGN
jgi:hypothetical protein